MRVVISGMSGFIGSYLYKTLKAKGHEVEGLVRDDFQENKLNEKIQEGDVVINLAGAPIVKKWTNSYKQELYDSRINTTKALVEVFKHKKPKLFISNSAIGIYKASGLHTEDEYDYSSSFLAKLCKDWEKEARVAEYLGVRTIVFRLGVVLGLDGGALSQMLTPFKMGLGGTIGDGTQNFSWIHIQDVVDAYMYAMMKEEVKGVYNLVSPEAITNYCFTKALGRVLKRPTLFPVPEFVLKWMFSEGAVVLTKSQKAFPKRLLEDKFTFKYDNIDLALENLLHQR